MGEGNPPAAEKVDDMLQRSPSAPSVHVRAIITWVAIFPMAAIGMTILTIFAPTWPPVLKALVLTAFVVPTAVYLAVPRLLRIHSKMRRAPTAQRH
ncbi:hypothetical protein [Subtercola lobariae]|uniref:Uncharacterized protein n=1 Tax=Subtercola lobariae TaxID=1588641 RepID=A0A917EZ79_9MICO|nr:hypothetical protein [Subtercola lobariae]GGF32899.1 hypothetical protein GCM10011399_27540 [Subtercola lobariae]